jgi:hypothetical protein
VTVDSVVSVVTVICVAVDTAVIAVAVRYQRLFVPPEALNVMGRLTQIDSGVPAFSGAFGGT